MEKVNKTKALAYLRVSTAEQANEYGLDAQKAAIMKYAEENDIEIVGIEQDICSGVKEERPALNKILYEITNPPFEAVIVFKNDRIARDTKLYFYYLFLLEKKNIKLISVMEQFAEGSELANVMRSLMMFAAEQERYAITKRTTAGRNQKALNGGFSGGHPPFGYKVSDGNLVPDEPAATIVRTIFQAKATGYSLEQIALYLFHKGFRPKKGGKKFSKATIKYILDNQKTYLGYYKYGENEWVIGQHKPLITVGELKEWKTWAV